MTSRKTSRGTLGALAILAAGLLAGCDLGHPGGYVARSNSYCEQTSTQIAKLDAPTTPKKQLQYALDRYTLVERLVSEMTESNLPGGQEGRDLKSRWLHPAEVSLVDGRSALTDLRSAVEADDRARADAAFDRADAIGTRGVDAALLEERGLARCATLFTPGAP